MDQEIDTTESEDSLEEDLESLDDSTNWKAKAEEFQGLAKRNRTREKKFNEKITALEDQIKKFSEQKPSEDKSSDLDYGQLAFLKLHGIEEEEDVTYLLTESKSTGKNLKDVLSFKYIQEHLKEKKETRTSQEAIPPGSKRSASSAKSSVDYWLAKNQLPDDMELRRKVVKERIRQEESKSRFADEPVLR